MAHTPRRRPLAAQKLDAWNPQFADFIPSNERVSQILEQEEQVPPLSEFITIFEAPTDLALSEDKVWPPNRPLVY